MTFGSAAIVLPFRAPIPLASMIASLHDLSAGRFILGIASGGRPAASHSA